METFDSLLLAAYRKASVELSQKTMEDIQRETAFAWCGRAIAAFAIFEETRDIHNFSDAEEFGHEAIEHAALAGEPGFSDAIAAVVQARKARALADHVRG